MQAHAQEGNRVITRSFAAACTSTPTVLPSIVGAGRTRSSEHVTRSRDDDDCTPDSNTHQQSKQKQQQTTLEPNSLLSRFASLPIKNKSSTSNIHSGLKHHYDDLRCLGLGIGLGLVLS